VYYNVTDLSSVDNHSELFQHLSAAMLNNDHITSSGLIELNVGLASNRVYNVLYENVAYCLVAFLVPLTTLVAFNVRLVVELRRSRQLRRTLRPLQFMGDGSWRARDHGALPVTRTGGTAGCSGHDETNITLVMIVIIVVFIVCQLPASANQVIATLRTKKRYHF